MTTKMRSLRNFRNPIGCLILLAALGAAAGCSTAENPGGSATNMNHVLPSGSSVPGWMVLPTGGSHASTATQDYIASGGASGCTECHGSNLSGGISGTSCFGNPAGCHHDPVANWTTPAVHGATAKKAPGSSGFASCQICHGRDFSGGGAGIACASCHGVPAPHPARPWHGPTFTHASTNALNAPVCAQCHFPGSANNPANHPATPAPAGTSPGCFNSTLCHGDAGAVPHPVGATWVTTPPAAQPHANDAKAASGATTGFSYCQACHGAGTDFAGGSSTVSCYPCHGVNAPHAPAPWRASAGSTYSHTTTVETGNAAVCAFCHFPGSPNNPANHPPTPAPAGTPPGCFNSTLCHAAGVPHPIGAAWVAASPAPQPHANDAKATPAAAAGYAYCQTCHGAGTDFAGGSSTISCYPCHGPTANSPHASQWRTGDTYVHTTTATGNAAVCAFCHTAGANSPIPPPPAPAPGSQPDCFNNTLCHGPGFHPAGWAQLSQHGAAAKAIPSASGGFSYCQACHGTGTTPPANFGGGTEGPSCYPCHGVSAPHPAGATWRGGGTPTHRTTNQAQSNLDVCAQCHRSATPGTVGCFNNTLCHN